MPALTAVAVSAALVLAAVHVVTPVLRSLHGTPRNVWLSIAGGVSVSYVFVHLLPELASSQAEVSEVADDWALGFAERHVYVVALAGLAVFYGLEHMAKTSRGQIGGSERSAPEAPSGSTGVFWVHMLSFGLYNAIVGYLLLHLDRRTTGTLIAFTAAMAMHFVVTDYGLAEHHQHTYRRIGRWVLVAAVLGGAALGLTVQISEAAVAVLIAFLAGGIILNVIKEEIPSERRSRFWAFGLGIVGYTILLLAL